MEKNQSSASKPVPVRMSKTLRDAIQRDAARSGWSLSEQIRFELERPRGLWKEVRPCLPTQGAPRKGLA
mgnify:CR=1 FL=1